MHNFFKIYKHGKRSKTIGEELTKAVETMKEAGKAGLKTAKQICERGEVG